MSENEVSNEERKILVVDDDPASIHIVVTALEYENYQVQFADSGEKAVDEINAWKPHLILLDMSMPGLNGLETLKLLRKQDEYVSTIFVSGKSATESVIQGLDSGADDYIKKPFDILELLARVRSQLRIKDLQDQLKAANAKLQQLVDIDDLTGLFNMRSLYKNLDHELARAKRYGRSVCVVMMDMDNFKNVNDSNDHLFGSFVLSEVGAIVRENIREVDFAARYGGDEFLIVLTEIDEGGAMVFCERLRKKIANFHFKNDHSDIYLTSSMGFAVSPQGSLKIDARTLVRFADRALYKAKDLGKDRVCFHEFDEGELSNEEKVKKMRKRPIRNS